MFCGSKDWAVAIVVELNVVVAQAMYIPNGQSSIMRTAMRKGWGHVSGLPKAVFDQLKERISDPIWPPPFKNAGIEVAFVYMLNSSILRGLGKVFYS